MTHDIALHITTDDWEKIEEIRDSIGMSNEFLEIYNLVKSEHSYQQQNGSQPFIYLPSSPSDKDDDEPFLIHIESGSHVAPEDTLYALHWFYFTLAFKEHFKEELEDCKMFYIISSNQDEELSEEEILKKIMENE